MVLRSHQPPYLAAQDLGGVKTDTDLGAPVPSACHFLSVDAYA